MTEAERLRLVATARARAAASAQPSTQGQPAPQERGFGAALYDNVVGNPNDGVKSYGESLGTWLNRGGESMTLGTVGDEASAAVTGMLPGRSYGGELDRYRKNEDDMSTAGRLSADLFGAIAPAALGVGAVARAPGLAWRMATGFGLGAGAGSVQGFAEGEGGLGPRVNSGLVGGLFGAGLGAIIPGAAEVGRQGVRAVKDGLRESRVGSQIGKSLGVSPEAGRFMGNVIDGEDQASMRGAFDRAGPNAMLADGSPALAGRLDATMRSPVPGAGLARDRVEQRAGQSYYNTLDAMNPQQGPRLSVAGQMDQIRSSTAGARGDAYDAAYAQEIDWRSPAGERLRQLINSTPNEVKSAAARSRGMSVRPENVPPSMYPELADSVRTTNGPMSAMNAEQQDVDAFFSAYGQANGNFQRRPLTSIIKRLGGVDPNSVAGQELKAMDITSRNSPGLFRKGGMKDLDNLEPSLFPDSIRGQGGETYMDRQALIDGLAGENNGIAVRTFDEGLDKGYADDLERQYDSYVSRRDALSEVQNGPSAPASPSELVPTQTVEDIDAIKRQLDAIVDTNDGTGKLGGQTPYGMFAKDRAVAIRDALREAAPGYGEALETAADPIRRRQSVEFGAKLLSPGVVPDDAIQDIARATGGEIAAMRSGVNAQIEHVLGNVRAIGSDANIEPRQALEAMRQLSSPNSQRKMEALYGDQWPTIKQSIDQASAAIGLRGATAANSSTFARQISDREITDSVTPGALRRGKPLDATKNFIGGMTGASEEAIAKMRDQVKGEVADLLTRQGGAPQQITQSALQALMANPMRMNAGNGTNAAMMLGGATGMPALTQLLTGLLTGTQ